MKYKIVVKHYLDTARHIGRPSDAANRLGLKRTTFIPRMKKLRIDPNAVSEMSCI